MLVTLAREQLTVDREIAAILRDAAIAGERLFLSRTSDNISSRVFRAQVTAAVLELRREQARMWGDITGTTRRAIARASRAAAEQGIAMDQMLEVALPTSAIPIYRQYLEHAARVGIDSVLSKRENNIALSARVYRTRVLAQGQVDREIFRLLALGRPQREIAAAVRKFIRPDVPGGVSYAAQRLGRTEVQNAFHATQRAYAVNNPYVRAMKWELSGSHPKPDECDQYASEDGYRMGSGVFPVDNVPDKPHPQCLCFLTNITPSREEFIQQVLSTVTAA